MTRQGTGARGYIGRALPSAAFLVAALSSQQAKAVESAFSNYLVGTLAFGAGSTPPAGWYTSTGFIYYSGNIGSYIAGGIASLGVKTSISAVVLSELRVLPMPVLGGQLGVSVNLSGNYVTLKANVDGAISRSANDAGWGFGDTALRAQLGWNNGALSHTLYATVFAPTGGYNKGFSANAGLNRWAGDLTWAATYVAPKTNIEVTGAAGVTINGSNPATNYDSGSEVHLEAALGKRFAKGLTFGVAGYANWQVSADGGPGARLGGFEGRVFGVGPALNYATLLGQTPLNIAMRHYEEFDTQHRFSGGTSIVTITVGF